MNCRALMLLLPCLCAYVPSALGDDGQRRSDDPSPVQSVIDNLVSAVQTLQARVTSQEARISDQTREIAELRAITNRRVAFSANNIEGKQYPAASGDGVIPFEQVITNVGNAYNPQTSVFTAPYDGDYYISVDINVSPDYEILAVKKNNVDMFYADKDDTVTSFESASAVLSLKAGDVISVHHVARDHGFVEGGKDSIFTGFLIR